MPTSSLLHHSQIPAGGRLDLRDLLILGGAGQFTADLSIPFMNMLPGTTDPYAQGVIQLVTCLQRLLNAQGARLEVDGKVGAQTRAAIMKFSGPKWYEKSWAQIFNDAIVGAPWKGFRRSDMTPLTTNIAAETATNRLMQGMGSYFHGLDGIPSGSQWTLRNGVAIPLTSVMLAYFQSIQRAVNAINAKEKRPLIAVDGRIGTQTADAVATIAVKHGNDPWINVKITPAFVAENAPDIVGEFVSLMSRLGATYVADPAVAPAKVSTVTPDGTVHNPPDGFSTTQLVIGAVAVGALVAVLGKKKRRK